MNLEKQLGDLLQAHVGRRPTVVPETFLLDFSRQAQTLRGQELPITSTTQDWLLTRDLGQLWRIEMLLLAVDFPDFPALLTNCFRKGDTAERCAVLQALSLLPVPERFLPLALEACRSHILTIFCAIACENPYPAHFFPDANFHQLVLKALFLDVSLGRIIGLSERKTSELIHMAKDYAAERRAAGRSISTDLQELMEYS